ncbi:PDZ domain-containing protein [Nicoliella spurrieriana]|uniref:PDZ domain-containing protein n=1 Tax=Nicoliella spurrieriana TaxID=2925830 RepID=A0A976X5I1_9LACO|nr:PDZ domain-containing protein [Nicoliella spurrieriana]UQS86983.1 PDZ domain-containing protein [Nicoliella spurrieriana]
MTITWLLVYQLLLLVNLLFIPGVIFSFEIVIISTVIVALLNLNQYAEQFFHFQTLQNYGMWGSAPANFNYVLLASLFLFGLAIMVAKDGGKFNVPIIERNERQVRIAGYPFKSINVIPLFLFIPGDWIHNLFQFWPVFVLNGQSYAFLIAPILFSFRMTIFKQAPRVVFKKLAGRFAKLALFGILLSVASYFFAIVAVPALGSLLVIYWWLLMRAKAHDKAQGDWYSEVINGVRVVGIEPKTPAAKMNLSIGDVILEVNNIAVTNEDEFYQALLTQSTYCRLKVENRQGQLAITETAIFSNAPHELGVVLFKQES